MKEPFINHMFPDCYTPPWKADYSARTENIVIYSYYEKFINEMETPYCEFCDEELSFDNEGDLLICNCVDAKEKYEKFPNLKKVTLKDIINLLPDGVNPDDVKMSIKLDLGPMSINGQEVSFFYEKAFKDDPEGFKAAQQQYEKNYQAYLVEKQKYDEWLKQQEIKSLEDKLAKLKK